MSGFEGVCLFPIHGLKASSLKSSYAPSNPRTQSGRVTVGDLPPIFAKLRSFIEIFSEDDIKIMLGESGLNMEEEIDFESFLKAYLNLQTRATKKSGGKKLKSSVSFLKAATTTVHHNINESEKASYVSHVNGYLAEDPFLKKYLPIDPATNALFDLIKDGVLLCKLINVAVPGTIDELAINTKGALNPWERNENHTLCLNSAKAIDCTVVNIGTLTNGLSLDTNKMSFAEMMTDDAQTSREERCFRLWINSLGTATYVNNVFEDVRNGWVLLEVLDKVSPVSVNWKLASRPPIKMPFRKVENCNQVIKIGKDLCFSLVNVAGNDIVQGNKKLMLAYLWQLMRFTMLQLLKNLRSHSSHSQGKEITDADILKWANNKVKKARRTSQMESFKDKNLSNGIFFLELLSAVEPRVVNWSVVTKGETDEDKKLNAIYIISVARKLGCSIFLLPEDIIEVNQKMILTLTASIMYWSLQQQGESESSAAEDSDVPDVSPAESVNGENEAVLVGEVFNLAVDDAVSDSTVSTHAEEPSSNVEEKDADI